MATTKQKVEDAVKNHGIKNPLLILFFIMVIALIILYLHL